MPFEFTGKPPALQDSTHNPFTSFPTPANASIPASAFRSSGPFGTTSSSPWSTQSAAFAAPAPSPSGAQGPPVFVSIDTAADELLEKERAALDSADTGDALMQALRRAVNGRPAVFGDAEMANDRILSGFVEKAAADAEGNVKKTSAQLSKEIRAALDGNPLAKAFVNHLLSECCQQRPRAQSSLRESRDGFGLSFGKQGQPNFARGSPAYDRIVSRTVEALQERQMLDSATVDVETLAANVAEQMGRGVWLVDVQRTLEVGLGIAGEKGKAENVQCGGFIDWMLRMVDEVVHGDKLATRAVQQPIEKDGAVATPNLPGGVVGATFRDHEETAETKPGGTSSSNPSLQDKNPQPEPATEHTPFRLLDLPPELRMWVYRALLAPGHISIRCDNDHRYRRIVPKNLTPSLSSTCRQVYNEAKDILYTDNTICLNVYVGYGNFTLLGSRPLPTAALARLKSVMLLIDEARVNAIGLKDYTKIDWRQLQAMTALAEVRLACMDDVKLRNNHERKMAALEQILERLPSTCKLSYGARAGPEAEHVAAMFEVIRKSSRGSSHHVETYVVEGHVLEECAREHLGRVGCKSGHTRDYRFPEKRVLQLGSLVKDEELDESIVLGR